jgi:hypothetical protein
MPSRNRPLSLDGAISNTLFFGLFLAGAILLVRDGLSVPLVSYAAFTDYWEHTAALTEWMRNLSAPTNPHVVSADLSSRYMPYFWLLSVLGQNLSLSAVQLMSISAVINYCLIALGLYLFLRYYFRDVWAPLVGFIAIFMLWGIGWNWSNLYQLRSFFYVGGYPSTFVFGLSLIAFWATLKYLRQDGSPLALGALLAVLSVLMLLCHPLTAVFGLTGCAVLAMTEKTAPAATRVGVVGILLSAAVAAELWPYFSVWKLMLGQYGEGVEQWPALRDINPWNRFAARDWAHLFYNPSVMVPMLGPVLLGIPVVIWLWLKRQHNFIVVGAFLMMIPFVANLFFPIPLAHRFLLFAAIYLQFALVWFLLTLLTVCRAEPRPAWGTPGVWGLFLLLAAVVAANYSLLQGEYNGRSLSPENFEVRDKRALLPDDQNVIALYETLTETLDDSAVVMTTASLGWPLPTVKGKVVSLYHENPILLDQLERYQATGDFFYRPISANKRAELVTRYNATHVLISGRDKEVQPALGNWLESYARLVSSVDSYRMYLLLDTVPRIKPQPVAKQPEVTRPVPTPLPRPVLIPTERTEVMPDVVPPADAVDAEPSSFGAPIASPILNLPEESLDANATDADSAAADQSFGAPVAEPLLPEPDGSAPTLPQENIGTN